MSQSNFWYCKIYLHYVENVDKVKMDYSLYPLVTTDSENILKSANSDEKFNLVDFKKTKIGFVRRIKLKDGIYFSFIFENQIDDFQAMEKSILPIVRDYVSSKLVLSRYKKFFLNRINFLIENE